MNLIKFVGAWDIHVGWERTRENGKGFVTRPVHDVAAIRCLTSFIQDFKPDYTILGGDQLNFGPISHWNRGRPILTENLRLKAEYDLFQDLIMGPIHKYSPNRVFIIGNHERWIYDLVAEKPGLEGIIEPESYLKLKECGWKIVEQGGHFKLGKLYFMHGDSLRSYGGKFPAQTFVSNYRRNLRIGHYHRFQAASDIAVQGTKDFHDCIIVPPLCRSHLGYTLGAPCSIHQGFLFGYLDPRTGNFNDYIVKIHKGRAFIEGKVYGG